MSIPDKAGNQDTAVGPKMASAPVAEGQQPLGYQANKLNEFADCYTSSRTTATPGNGPLLPESSRSQSSRSTSCGRVEFVARDKHHYETIYEFASPSAGQYHDRWKPCEMNQTMWRENSPKRYAPSYEKFYQPVTYQNRQPAFHHHQDREIEPCQRREKVLHHENHIYRSSCANDDVKRHSNNGLRHSVDGFVGSDQDRIASTRKMKTGAADIQYLVTDQRHRTVVLGSKRSPTVSPQRLDDKKDHEQKLREPQMSRSMQIAPLDAAFVLGRGGRTKQKISIVSGAELILREDSVVSFLGPAAAQERAMLYVALLAQQRVGQVQLPFDPETRDDCTLVAVPSTCVAFVTGHRGCALRGTEFEWKVLMFFVRASDEACRKAIQKYPVRQNSKVQPNSVTNAAQSLDTTAASKSSVIHQRCNYARSGSSEEHVNSDLVQNTDSNRKPTRISVSPTSRAEDDSGRLSETRRRYQQSDGFAAEHGVEILAIFGDLRSRVGAELKILSAIDQKLNNYYDFETLSAAESSSDVPQPNVVDQGPYAGFRTGYLEIDSADFSYALGRDGTTRRKLAAASDAIVEYVGRYAVFWGSSMAISCGKRYLRWLITQRSRPVTLAEVSPYDDVALLKIPRYLYTRCGGARALQLRNLEAVTGTFCFILEGLASLARRNSSRRPNGDDIQPEHHILSPDVDTANETLAICSALPLARDQALRLVRRRLSDFERHSLASRPPHALVISSHGPTYNTVPTPQYRPAASVVEQRVVARSQRASPYGLPRGLSHNDNVSLRRHIPEEYGDSLSRPLAATDQDMRERRLPVLSHPAIIISHGEAARFRERRSPSLTYQKK